MLVVEIKKGDFADCSVLTSGDDLGIDVIESDNLDATGVEIITIVVPLATAAISAIAKVAIEAIRSRKYIKIKRSGVEITGLTADNAQAVLQEILKQECKKPA